MNTYIVGIQITGRTGQQYGMPLTIESATDRFDAVKQAKELMEKEGFSFVDVDYVDIVEGRDFSPYKKEVDCG